MPRQSGRLVAVLTSLLVALCTCGIAPFALSEAVAATLASAASTPFCSRSGECPPCPSSQQSTPAPADCKGCPSSGCGFEVVERFAPAPPNAGAVSERPSTRVALAASAAHRRVETLGASPPLHVLHESFRN